MEYRAFLKIPGLTFADESKWEPLIERLERQYAQFGPVIGFDEGGAEIIVSMSCSSEADAAQSGVDAVVNSLRSVGLSTFYPASVEVERVAAEDLASA
jgi:hypothetical protein